MAAEAAAYFDRDDDWFVPTEAATSPWDTTSLHAGTVAALLGRAIERHDPREGFQVGRITVEVLRRVPMVPVRTAVSVVRSGRQVEHLVASLEASEGELMRASAWRLRTTDVAEADLPAIALGEGDPLPPPDEVPETPLPPWTPSHGYMGATEWRFFAGGFGKPGPGKAWLRMRLPLLAGEPTSPLTRVLTAADSGSGVSSVIDFFKYVFMNVDLTVHLRRPLEGEWVGMDSRTTIQPHGVSLTETCVHDSRGPIGRAVQTLFVGPRA